MIAKQTPVSERVAEIVMRYENGNKASFARAIGITPQGVGDLIKGSKGGPSFSVLQNILMHYSDVRMEWLVFGVEPMLKADILALEAPPTSPLAPVAIAREEEAPRYSQSPRVLTVQVGLDEEENIELVTTRAAAGYARHGRIEREFIRELPSFRLPDPAYRSGSFRCFQVSGDSMQSTLYPGDWVICRYVERWDRDIQDTRVYVIVTDDEVLIKRVSNRLNERDQLTLHSDNPAIPVQFLDGERVREIWYAVGRLSRQFINPRYDTNIELSRHAETLEELLRRVDALEKDNG